MTDFQWSFLEEGDLKAMAGLAINLYKEFMVLTNVPQPRPVFFTKTGCIAPKDVDGVRITKLRLEMTKECYVFCSIVRLRDPDGKIVREDSLWAFASNGGDKTYHIQNPFTYKTSEKRGPDGYRVKVVEFEWEKEGDLEYGPHEYWQSRSKTQEFLDNATPQEQNFYEQVVHDSGFEEQPDDLLKALRGPRPKRIGGKSKPHTES